MTDRTEIERGESTLEREVFKAKPAREPIPENVPSAVASLSQGMSSLVRGHLALARVEMARDLKALGKNAAMEFGGTPMLLVGYLLFWVGIGYLIALGLPTWLSFLICSAANFIAGAVLILLGRARMKKEKPRLPATSFEVKRDREWLTTLKEPPETLRGHLH